MLSWLLDILSKAYHRVNAARLRRRWERLRAAGMKIGKGVNLPASTWIDTSHCFLIEIGDNCGFGPECMILAHDAQMDEFIDAARLGRIVIRESCHIGARTVILAGVEMGPRTLVGANSVVSRSLPPDTVCAGSPAKVICSLDEYLDKHRRQIESHPTYDYDTHDIRSITPEARAAMVEELTGRDGYMLGGRSAELRREGGTPRTDW